MEAIAWDRRGVPILPGDLIKTFHYRDGRRNMYLYHIVEMDESGKLRGHSYNSWVDHYLLIGKQVSTEVVAGLHQHEIDDPIIRPYFRRFVWTDASGRKCLRCQPHERVKVKDVP